MMKHSKLIATWMVMLGVATMLSGCFSAWPVVTAQPSFTPTVVATIGTTVPPTVIPTVIPTVPLPRPTVPTVAPTSTAMPPTAVPPQLPASTMAVPPVPVATPIDVTLRQQIFDQVWSIIDERYLYPDFGGVDWQAVRVEFQPRISEAPTDEAFYQLINLMVARLDDDHSRFVPPQAARREDDLTSGREEQVGIGVIALPLNDGLMIQHIFPDSPALHAGLLPRDRIVAIDGVFYTNADLQGPEESQVRLTVVRPGESSRDILITRRRVEGGMTPTARLLPGDIGYINITTLWVNDMDQQVAQALTELTSTAALRGLIIDLRSNPGGWRNVMTGILSHFISGEVGSFTNRQGNIPLVIEPTGTPDLRGVPLIVLIDHGTASYAEVIAAILQGQAGAVVIGVPTGGNTETIYSYELTGGARLWVAQEGFVLFDGRDLEGLGVQPDIMINDDWTRFSETDDPGITTALRLLAPYTTGR